MAHYLQRAPVKGRPCAYKDGHPGNCTSEEAHQRILAKKKARRLNDPDFLSRVSEYNRRYQKEHTGDRRRQAFYAARRRAAKKNVPFTLSLDDIPAVPEFCPILGILLESGDPSHDLSPSLDRIKPKLGYVAGNIRWISNRANRIKTNATAEEIMLVALDLQRLERLDDQ